MLAALPQHIAELETVAVGVAASVLLLPTLITGRPPQTLSRSGPPKHTRAIALCLIAVLRQRGASGRRKGRALGDDDRSSNRGRLGCGLSGDRRLWNLARQTVQASKDGVVATGDTPEHWRKPRSARLRPAL